MRVIRKKAAVGAAALVTGAAALTGAVALSSGSASAKNNVDLSDTAMIDTCPQMEKQTKYKADRCEFEPTGYESWQSDFYIPKGDMNAWNCGSEVADHQWQLTDVEQQSNSFGIDLSVGVELFKIVEAKVSVSYGHEWMHGSWQWTGNTEHIAPGKVGWMEMSTEMLKVNGNWKMNFGDPVAFDPNGDPGGYHYEWTLFGYSQTAKKKDGNHSVVFKDRDMTPEEKERVCGNRGLGPGEGPPGTQNKAVERDPGLVLTPLDETQPNM